ncbi:CoA transferase [Aromatoleum diolicum]|uniref:CoA transferase n=1 Tax=Aromatoleum diolicum TaxID=75796 RepID=A0ABX1QDV2_9RHOO|nr:CoA transferase [Aromatoleum diolicum]NMG76473.1 CoA transferase [Aromatoleum diolicum]
MANAGIAPLDGFRVAAGGQGTAGDYARLLLASLGAQVSPAGIFDHEHPALAWKRSGLMDLTGRAEGPPRMCPVPLAACADGVIATLAALAEGFDIGIPSGAALLGVRARHAGLRRNGAASPGGSCRLLRTADGELAINLARPDDWALVPAWLECDATTDWEQIATAIARASGTKLLERARLLGLAAAVSDVPTVEAPPWVRLSAVGTRLPAGGRDPAPLVVDLSSLWAGPLCGHLLHRLGARVVKVESHQREDGARNGPPAFFDLLNAGKASVRLDLATLAGRSQLRQLVARADIVIEASRPRAMRQLGICAEEVVAARPGVTWLSITGHGREEPQAGWIAFGDDAGVAAGLSRILHDTTGERLICADAIGDPLTGTHAALAAWASYLAGGGHLVALSLAGVLGHCVAFDLPASAEALRERNDEWTRVAGCAGACRSTYPAPAARARPIGADTQAVLAELDIRC